MHIQIDGDRVGGSDLHWRGVALADFDGHTWSNPREQFILRRQPDNSFNVPPANAALRSSVAPFATQRLVREHVIHYRVLMEPIGTNVFFLAPWAHERQRKLPHAGRRYRRSDLQLRHQRAISRYEADSDIATATPADLRSRRTELSRADHRRVSAPSGVDPRVPRLAAQITNSATNDFDKAAAIENYLRPASATPLSCPDAVKDPIANFLFERKQGHCEYFASSMAVMLRTLGIPSRVVNGFRSDEFNDLTGNYVVRAKDAHAWVEAYFPGYGWQTFDPTPAGASGTPQGWEPPRALRRRHCIVLARLDRQLRHFAPVRARPGRVQRNSRSVGRTPVSGRATIT